MTSELQKKIEDSRRRAEEEKGERKFWQPEADRENHFRILEWPDHEECWIEGYVHFVETSEGIRMLACGGEDCFTCQKIVSLASDGTDMEAAKRARRVNKVNLYIIDWDDRIAGPQVFSPKNTQNCATWNAILSVIANPDYSVDTYKFKTGRLITFSISKEKRKFGGAVRDVIVQKSLLPGTRPVPIAYKKNSEGKSLIQVPLADGGKRVFSLPDLSETMPSYVEKDHRAAWGESVEEEAGEDFSGEFDEDEGAVPFSDEGETEKGGEETGDFGFEEPEPESKPEKTRKTRSKAKTGRKKH